MFGISECDSHHILFFKNLLEPPSQRCSPQSLPPIPGHKTLPLAIADWIKDGHLSQLDQSDVFPQISPWDILEVLGSFCWLLEHFVSGTVVGQGKTEGNKKEGPPKAVIFHHVLRAAEKAEREERNFLGEKLKLETSELQRERRRGWSYQGSCRHPSCRFPSLEANCTSCP